MTISNQTFANFKKKHRLTDITHLSAQQYQELMMMEQGFVDTSAKKQKFSFVYSINFLPTGYQVILDGKHLSKNRFKSRSDLLRFKAALNRAMEQCRLLNIARLRTITPLERASIHYDFYNPVSRDHDNNQETLKAFQDTFTKLGLIQDDKRECIGQPTDSEVISKSYRVVATILKAS